MYNYLIFIGSLKKGGAERNAALLANHLNSQGHQVKLLTLSPEIAFELNDQIERKTIGREKYTFRNLKIIHIWYSLLREVWRVKPRRLITLSRIGGIIASCTFYPRTIVRFDIYPFIGYKAYKKIQFFLLYNLPWVKFVVCPSKELLQDVSRYFLSKKKLTHIYNPINVNNVVETSNQDENQTKPYFLVLGRLHAQKQQALIIKAYSDFSYKEDIDLLIAGDGPEMANLKQLVTSLNLSDYVQFLGFVNDPKEIVSKAYCLLNASIREGFPNVLIESLSLKTPVISSKAKTGPAELIRAGENGFLFPVGDQAKLTELLNAVVSDKNLYQKIRKQCNLGLDKFSYQSIMNKWEEIL